MIKGFHPVLTVVPLFEKGPATTLRGTPSGREEEISRESFRDGPHR
jgi:hypothetical protein